MSEKINVARSQVIASKSGWTSYYDDGGTIRKVRNSQLSITEDEAPRQATEDSVISIPVEDAAPASPETFVGSSKPEKAKMATKAKKKATSKKVASAGSSIRMVAGREVDLSTYVRTKNASGQSSFDCGDKVAETLRGKDLDAVYEIVAKRCDVSKADLVKQYKHLNAGMQRMSLGNRLRKVMTPKAA